MATVREFVRDCYNLITPGNPTVPLHGDDFTVGLRTLNRVLKSYAGTGLKLTIARTETTTLSIGQREVVCGDAAFLPTPDITAGRLANLEDAWLILDGVRYPLIPKDRSEFLSAWLYDPLQSLPRFAIVFAETKIVNIRLYPAPSQVFEFYCRGKFELSALDKDDTLDGLPDYYEMFLLYAVAKKLSRIKARPQAWTEDYEMEFRELKDEIIASSEVNLSITGERDTLLNGAWRLRAGI